MAISLALTRSPWSVGLVYGPILPAQVRQLLKEAAYNSLKR
jgi:hypothetical protein